MRGLVITTIFILLIFNGPVRSQDDATPQPADDSGSSNNQGGQNEEDDGEFISADNLLSQSDGTGGEGTQINERAPQFARFERTTEVEENSIQFSPPINVRAVDPEGTMITYKIDGGDIANAFSIHPTLGTIQLTHPLTYQSTPLGRGRFDLTISATDSGVPKRTNTTQVTVIIIDKNDNHPVFLSSRYFANITELTTPGLPVRTVRATDNDAGVNKDIIYELQGSNLFTIDPRSGIVSIALDANLDIDENGNTHHLMALAKDQGRPQLTGSAMVTIYVSDSNNHPPMFQQNTYIATLSEGSSAGTTITTVQAIDSDSNANIVYEILSIDPSNYRNALALNRNSGAITTQRILQRENVGEINLVIKADDRNAEQPRPQTATATVQIILQTASDDNVEFSPPWSRTMPIIRNNLSEDTPVGTSVYTLRAMDESNSETITSFSEAPGSDTGNYFSVQQSTGIVTLNRELDYDTMKLKQVQLQVIARTSSFPYKTAVATIVFTVTDVNDNQPRFLQQSYNFRVSENVRFPTEIGTVTAVDADSGVFGQVYYTLSGDGSKKFYLDRISGKLVVASNETLDADERRVYDLIVMASDSGNQQGRSETASVRIELDDINDNAPQFSSAIYTTYTREETIPSGVSLAQVSATDKDVDFKTITYSIERGNDLGLFTIDPSTGVIRASRDLTPYVRSQSDPYRLAVKAWDNGASPLSVETRVDIYLIQSTNTTALSFIVPTRDRFVQEITEGLSAGTEVITITARDNSQDASGPIIYRLASETQTFNLNRTTGVLTTTMTLDREEREEYELTLVAQSQERPERETSRVLIIKVSDIDDNPPRYDTCNDVQYSDPHEKNVAELKRGESVMNAKACDLDSTPNNIIRYSIICGNNPRDVTMGNRPFKIDSVTGQLTSEVSLDARYTFQICIKASNGAGSVVPEEVDFFAENVRRNPSILRVIINVGGGLDFGDFPPNFPTNNATYTASILSNTPFHSEVIQIIASTASGAKLAYSLLNIRFSRAEQVRDGERDYFIIDRDDGTIHTNRQHFREFLNGNFTMEVDISKDGSVYAKAGVAVYVIPETGILRLTFNSPIERFTQQQRVFETEISAALKAQVVTTGVRYALTNNRVTSDKFDYCFHIRDGNGVYTYEKASQLLRANEKKMTAIYDTLQIGQPEPLGLCVDVNATTAYWSDHWYLWWIIIAIGIALGVFIILTIIWLCVCYYWSRNKVKTARPFLMLDTLNMSREQLEWQEQTVKMS